MSRITYEQAKEIIFLVSDKEFTYNEVLMNSDSEYAAKRYAEATVALFEYIMNLVDKRVPPPEID